MNECVLISGVIQHSESGYGFKVSMFTLEDAKRMKTKIAKYLKDEGYIVTNRGSYYGK